MDVIRRPRHGRNRVAAGWAGRYDARMHEHPFAIIERIAKSKGVTDSEMLRPLLACMQFECTTRISRMAGALGLSSSLDQDIAGIFATLGRPPKPVYTLFDGIDAWVEMEQITCQMNATSLPSPARDNFVRQVEVLKTLRLIIRELMNVAERMSVGTELAMEEMNKRIADKRKQKEGEGRDDLQ
jgi:hypothetical protein